MGTLNLCLKMPEKMQKTRNESDHPGLRKRQKIVKNCQFGLYPVLATFWNFFSAQDERINFSSFACCQATWDTSLEYPQGVLWRQKFFHFPRGLGNLFGQNRKPKWLKYTFLARESYHLPINTLKISPPTSRDAVDCMLLLRRDQLNQNATIGKTTLKLKKQ